MGACVKGTWKHGSMCEGNMGAYVKGTREHV